MVHGLGLGNKLIVGTCDGLLVQKCMNIFLLADTCLSARCQVTGYPVDGSWYTKYKINAVIFYLYRSLQYSIDR